MPERRPDELLEPASPAGPVPSETDAATERTADQLLASANDAASLVQRAFFTYLLVSLYLAVLIGSTTHEQLLRESGVQLPLFGVRLSVFWVYAVAPWLYVALHVNLLVQHDLLSQKLHRFSRAIRPLRSAAEWRLRLYPSIFAQMLAGAEPGSFKRFVLRGTVLMTVVVAPIALLLWAQIQFLPYHSQKVTWVNRLALYFDLIMLWYYWPSVNEEDGSWRRLFTRRRYSDSGEAKNEVRLVQPIVCLALSGLLLWFSLLVAVVPGGILDPVEHSEAPAATGCNVDQPKSAANQAASGTSPNGPAAAGQDTPSATGYLPECWGDGLAGVRSCLPRHLDVRETTLVDREPPTELLMASATEGEGAAKGLLESTAGLKLKERDLLGASLHQANLTKADLREANLEGAHLDQAELVEARLLKAKLPCAVASGAVLRKADLSGAVLEGANLSEAKLEDANLSGAKLDGADLTKAEFDGATLVGSTGLETAILKDANLHAAVLSDLSLSGISLKDIRKDTGLRAAILTKARLVGADLEGMRLDGADFRGAWLIGARLQGANLQGAYLNNAHLEGADLRNASLEGADLRGAYLRGADLRWAHVGGAMFERADLSSADLRKVDDDPLRLEKIEDSEVRTRLAEIVKRADFNEAQGSNVLCGKVEHGRKVQCLDKDLGHEQEDGKGRLDEYDKALVDNVLALLLCKTEKDPKEDQLSEPEAKALLEALIARVTKKAIEDAPRTIGSLLGQAFLHPTCQADWSEEQKKFIRERLGQPESKAAVRRDRTKRNG